MKDKDEKLLAVELPYAGIQEELKALIQSRSDFQLAHFVVGQHGSLESGAGPRMRYQALLELQALRGDIARSVIQRERLRREIERLEQTDPPDKDLDVAERRISLAEADVRISGRMREFDALFQILQALPHYSHEEFEQAEADYWRQRLSRQLRQGQHAAITGYDRGDLAAAEQCSGDAILPGIERITEWPGITAAELIAGNSDKAEE